MGLSRRKHQAGDVSGPGLRAGGAFQLWANRGGGGKQSAAYDLAQVEASVAEGQTSRFGDATLHYAESLRRSCGMETGSNSSTPLFTCSGRYPAPLSIIGP